MSSAATHGRTPVCGPLQRGVRRRLVNGLAGHTLELERLSRGRGLGASKGSCGGPWLHATIVEDDLKAAVDLDPVEVGYAVVKRPAGAVGRSSRSHGHPHATKGPQLGRFQADDEEAVVERRGQSA